MKNFKVVRTCKIVRTCYYVLCVNQFLGTVMIIKTQYQNCLFLFGSKYNSYCFLFLRKNFKKFILLHSKHAIAHTTASTLKNQHVCKCANSGDKNLAHKTC